MPSPNFVAQKYNFYLCKNYIHVNFGDVLVNVSIALVSVLYCSLFNNSPLSLNHDFNPKRPQPQLGRKTRTRPPQRPDLRSLFRIHRRLRTPLLRPRSARPFRNQQSITLSFAPFTYQIGPYIKPISKPLRPKGVLSQRMLRYCATRHSVQVSVRFVSYVAKSLDDLLQTRL